MAVLAAVVMAAAYKRSGRIMHKHNAVLTPQAVKCRTNRILSFCTARNDLF